MQNYDINNLNLKISKEVKQIKKSKKDKTLKIPFHSESKRFLEPVLQPPLPPPALPPKDPKPQRGNAVFMQAAKRNQRYQPATDDELGPGYYDLSSWVDQL
jgi:hypothetical protein